MPRRLLLVLIVVIAAAGGAWFWLPADDIRPPRHDQGAEANDDDVGRRGATGPSERAEAPGGVTTPPTADSGGDATTPKAADADPDVAAPNVTLLVRHSRNRAPVAAFRVTARHAGAIVRVDGVDGHAALALPAGASGELLVEADGQVPWQQPLQAPGAASPARHLEVFLDPSMVASGIELIARTLDRTPVADIRVEAVTLEAAAETIDWAAGKRLWSRRAADAEGRYRLPELAPGRYAIRLQATEADGTLLPLLPFERIFELTGSNGYREDIVLEPGCLLTLDLVDASGKSFDPSRTAIAIDLRLAGGPAVSRRWHQFAARGLAAAIDGLPGTGPAFLNAALAPGHYALQVSIAGKVRLRQTVVLRANERQTERAVLY